MAYKIKTPPAPLKGSRHHLTKKERNDIDESQTFSKENV